MLEPLAPTSRAATILGDGGPSALEVAYKRKGIEADIGKTLAEAEKNKAAAKAADDKNKIEQQKQFDLLPDTAKLPHTELFADIYNQEADNMAAILERNGGIVPLGGEDGREFRRSRQRIKQLASNSEQLDKEMLRQLAVVDANPDKFQPGTRENIIAIYSQPDWLTKGVLPTNVLEDHFDVSGYLTPLFEKIKADQTAYGGLTAEGGTEEGTRKFILRDDIKQVAEMGAADEVANAALRRQFANFSPETQARLKQIATDNKITQEAATALELGIGLVEYEEKTRNVTAPSSAGAGAMNLNRGVAWFAETSNAIKNNVYTGAQKPSLTGDSDFSGAIGVSPFTGKPVKVIGDFYDIYNGFVLKPGMKLGGPEGNTKLQNNAVIAGTRYDRGKDEWVVKVKTEDGGDLPTLRIPDEKWMSEVGPEVSGYNQEMFRGLGALLKVTDKEYQKVKGSGGLNLEGEKKNTGPFVPGKQSSGPYIPGR